MRAIGLLIDFDCAVIVGYREGKHPIYLFDSIQSERDLLFQRYLTTSFQHDPFYQKLDSCKQQGIFTLRDVAKKGTDYKDYCAQFYHQTGWKDELSMLIDLGSERWVMIYLGCVDEQKRFDISQLDRLKPYFPIIQSLCQQHWKQTPFTLSQPISSAESAQLRKLIEQALGSFGKTILTKREQEITALIAQGFDTSEIAQRLGLAHGTVKNHRKRIYAQLNVGSLSELFQLFLNHLITQSSS
uniref:response regulator transcription factor n=1 Tax=Thaumasiovibrio occultus TaxID=1891184 RepID=UPI000B3625F6|nr:helix-turn-helix transcriptional regulator [Thaumasiovibrio occultus]